MPKKYLKVATLFVLFLSLNKIHAQSFGFGCLGLSGFYAGVSEYSYKTSAINDFANSFSTSALQNSSDKWNEIKFDKGTGYRIGTNFFRAKWEHFFLSAKGYYQFVKENQTNTITTSSGIAEYNFQLTMNHWGVGVDFGIPLAGILDWKILDGSAEFYTSEFTFSNYLDNKFVSDNRFTPDKIRMGYYIGTGLILHIIPDYISVEASAGLNILEIDKFSGSGDSSIPLPTQKDNAIEKGGWSATVQVNVGFPL